MVVVCQEERAEVDVVVGGFGAVDDDGAENALCVLNGVVRVPPRFG